MKLSQFLILRPRPMHDSPTLYWLMQSLNPMSQIYVTEYVEYLENVHPNIKVCLDV